MHAIFFGSLFVNDISKPIWCILKKIYEKFVILPIC